MGKKALNIAGDFGSWTIIDRAESRRDSCDVNRTFWNVKCRSCFNKFEMSTKSIRRRIVTGRTPQGCDTCNGYEKRGRK